MFNVREIIIHTPAHLSSLFKEKETIVIALVSIVSCCCKLQQKVSSAIQVGVKFAFLTSRILLDKNEAR